MRAFCPGWVPLRRAGPGVLCPHGVVPACAAAEEELARAPGHHAALPGSVAVPPGVGQLNLLPWDRQLALGRAALGNFFALAKKKVGQPPCHNGGLRITSSLGSLAPAAAAGWVCVPRGCCGHVPCATRVMCCACFLCFADPGDQSLWGHPLSGRWPGCREGDVHKARSGTLLTCCYPLLAHVPQPGTSPALGMGCWGPCSDFPVLFPGLLAKVTAAWPGLGSPRSARCH